MSMSRRGFLDTFVKAAASYSILRMAWGTHTLAGDGRLLLSSWLRDLAELCGDLRLGRVSPELWQERMAMLYQGLSPEELMDFIDFPSLVERINWPGAGAAVVHAPFPELEGMPPVRGFGHKIFALRKGRAVVPHAHNDMVSAHFVVSGSFHVRTYNRRFDLEQRPGYLFVEPSLDTRFGPGSLLTMSDSRDNVHWLVAETDEAYTFDVPVTHLFPEKKYPTPANKYNMIFIESPELRGDDPVPVRVIDVQEALELYG